MEVVMDSENANYSYGLQRILKIGLKTIGFDRIKAMDRFGSWVAGGSVIKH
jgi:hypothetical protein